MVDKIQEYLIALGFDVNQPSYRHFADALVGAESMARKTGEAALGVGFAVEAMVAKVAKQQEHLYFVAQRTGSSVQALQAYEFGMTQIGVSADAARSSVEGFAMAIRQNPGLAGIARSLGVTDITNSVNATHQLVGRLRQLPDFIALQFAGMFGMDAQTYIQRKNNWETEEKQEKAFLRRQQEAGVGTREASDQFRKFSMTLRTVEGDFEILEQRLGLDWVQPATRVLELVDKLIVGFNNMDGSTRKLLMTVLTLWGAFKSLGMVAGVARKFGLISSGAAAEGGLAAGGLAIATNLRKGGLAGLVLAGAAAARQDAQKGYPLRDQVREFFGLPALEGWDRFGPVIGANGPVGGHWPHAGLWSPGQTHTSKPVGGTASEIMAFFMKQGWSREAAAGLAANLSRESRFNPNAVGDGGQAFGVAQWHRDRQEAFRQWAGHDIRGSTLEEQLGFVNYELTQGKERNAGNRLRGARTAAEAGGIVSQFYERPLDTAGEANLRGALAQRLYGSGHVTQTNQITINIHGADNPKATADSVWAKIKDNQEQMARIAAGALR